MRRNSKIILIMTDTQRWDMCGCYRDTGLRTPNIDRLAERGVRFERAYTAQPVCQPARAAIFTGLYPHSCGSWSNSMGISDNAPTLGRRLSDYGVHTAYVGKWHLDGGDYFGTGKCPPGWDPDYWYDMRSYLEELSDGERLISRNSAYMDDNDFPAELTYGRRCADKAESFLRRCGGGDFFLAVSFDEPHHPYMCPPPYSAMYSDYTFPKSPNVYDSLENKPDYQRVWAGGRQNADKSALEIRHRYYFGCNSFIDGEIGRVAEAAGRYAPDALIIYTSDHGDFLHSHSLDGKGPAAYDEITRIPLIFSGGGAPSGVVDPNPASHINLAPTIMEIMGFRPPRTMEGKSLAPELADLARQAAAEKPADTERGAGRAEGRLVERITPLRTNSHVFIEFGRYEVDHDGFGGLQLMRTVFDGRYKFTVNLLSGDELYDLERDPYEMDNLIASPPCVDIRDSLHDALLDHMNATRDPFRGYYWERRPWRASTRPAKWSYTSMTRQREEEEFYEKRQLDYNTGLEMTEAVRKK